MGSARRNELLAELFQRSHRIEKWGRGIKMILEREPATDFEEVGTVQFVVTFKRQTVEQPSISDFKKSSVKIIEVIQENNTITAVELSQLLGISIRAVEKQIAKLKQDGMLRRIGPDKGGYWEISS